VEIVQLLILQGADIEAQDEVIQTSETLLKTIDRKDGLL
jgi:hypothetical protein